MQEPENINIQSVAEAPVLNVQTPEVVAETSAPVVGLESSTETATESEEELMQIVFHDEVEEVVQPVASIEEPVIPTSTTADSPMAAFDEAEAQKIRAAERLYKLRNLSFNFNAADPNNEYDSIPAYVRHNLQVHNTTLASVEKFYSSYSVGTDDQNNTQISTINICITKTNCSPIILWGFFMYKISWLMYFCTNPQQCLRFLLQVEQE